MANSSIAGIAAVKTVYVNLALSPLLWSVLAQVGTFFFDIQWYLYLNFLRVYG